MKTSLRWYQQEAVDSIINYPGQAGVVNLPTGAGKSIVIAETTRILRERGLRVINAVHVGELVAQNAAAIERHVGERVGILSASVGRKDIGRAITVTGVGTAARRDGVGAYDVLIIDECHCVNLTPGTLYSRLVDMLRQENPELRIIGLSATPWRMNGPVYGDGQPFCDMIYSAGTPDAFRRIVSDGYLSPLSKGRARTIDFPLPPAGLDYSEGDAGHKIEPILPQLVGEVLEESDGRRKGLMYLPTVETAMRARDFLRERGLSAQCITGATPKGERKAIIDAFRADGGSSGQTWLTSVSALTTGLDVPDVDVLAILRPTKSSALNVQILGRGTRIAPGKTDCLVLDFAGNIERCGPIDDPIIPKPRIAGGGVGSPTRYCPMCGTECHASAKTCPQCRYAFPAGQAPSIVTGTVAPMSTILSRTTGKVSQTILPSTRSARLVSDNRGRLYCRLEWSANLSTLLTASNAVALTGAPLGEPAAAVQHVIDHGTRPVVAHADANAKYTNLRIVPADKHVPGEAWWPVTTTPAMRGMFARMLFGEDVPMPQIMSTAGRAGFGSGCGALVPGMVDLARSGIEKRFGACTPETFATWVQSLADRMSPTNGD